MTSQVLLRHQIGLPSTPNDGVALAHEEPVAGIFEGTRIVSRRGVVEKGDDPLATSIRGIVENLTVAPFHIHRFQNTEVAPVFDSASSVSRCFIQVDDDFIQAVFWIDLAINFADEFLVGTGNGEFIPLSERFFSLNDQSRDHCFLNFPWR